VRCARKRATTLASQREDLADAYTNVCRYSRGMFGIRVHVI
jgi:hypothetical protein